MVYIGTYTGAGSEGIYGFHMDKETGQIDSLGLMAKAENPSYLALSKNQNYLYAVYETNQYNQEIGGAVGSYKLNSQTGSLQFLNEQRVLGKAPCHLCLDNENHHLFTANYNDGSVSVFELNEDGSLDEMTDFICHEGQGPDKERQERAHAHFVSLIPDKKHLYVADLGMDQIKVYDFNEVKGKLYENLEKTIKIEPGSGPRHIAFHPSGRFFYLINELSSSIVTFSLEQDKDKNEIACNGNQSVIKDNRLLQTVSTIPDNFHEFNNCSAVKITPDGRFLFGANRGHDSIAAYEIDYNTGKLALISHTFTDGKCPRDIEIDPQGKWLLAANQESDNITAFQIKRDSGELELIGSVISISKPVCIKIIE